MSSEVNAPAGVKGRSHSGEKMTGYPLCAARVGEIIIKKKTIVTVIFNRVNI